MARMNNNDRSVRVLRLLLGLRDRQIGSALARYGFADADLKEGWDLLRAAGSGVTRTWSTADTDETLSALDEWENKWFPIVHATLEHRYPAVDAVLFRDLTQTSGPGVAVTVRTLVDRLEQLAATASESPDAKAALELLARRGLDDGALAEARTLLDRLATFAENAPLASDAERAHAEAAEAKLWAWYLEWSRIARIAVTGRLLLRRLGFLQTVPGGGEVEVDVDDEDVAAPTEPDPTSAFAGAGVTSAVPKANGARSGAAAGGVEVRGA